MFALNLIATNMQAQRVVTTIFAGSAEPSAALALGIEPGLVRDSAGNIVFAEPYRLRRLRPDGTIEEIAGTGRSGFSGDGGPARAAAVWIPYYPAIDSSGNLYFYDFGNNRIRRIDSSGIITTIAGTGIRGSIGADGPAASAQLGLVNGLSADVAGNVYFSDGTFQVRRVTPNGKMETVAGASQAGNLSDGDGGPALAAHIAPDWVFAAPDGSVYVHDYLSASYRKITPGGPVVAFAGKNDGAAAAEGVSALNARFTAGGPLVVDKTGVYIVDNSLVATQSSRIWQITGDGLLHLVAGGGTSTSDGPVIQAKLPFFLQGIATDGNGGFFFHDGRQIRQVNLQGSLTTVAQVDSLSGFSAFAVSPKGEIYVATDACTIQRIDAGRTVTTVAGSGVCSLRPVFSGPAASTSLTPITSTAVDSSGRVHFADAIYVYSIAEDGSVAPLPGFSASVNPQLAVDPSGQLYILAASSTGVSRLSRRSPAGIFEGLSSWFPLTSFFTAIGVDPSENVYLTERSRTSSGTAGSVYRFSPSGAATRLQTSDGPVSIAIDAAGTLSEVVPASVANGVEFSEVIGGVKRVIGHFSGNSANGNPIAGYSGDGGPVDSAFFGEPAQVAAGADGSLYVLDKGNHAIRVVRGARPATAPSILPAGVVNAASFLGGAIAPGELVAIFGKNLGPAEPVLYTPQNNFVPPVLGNVQVFLGAYAAPLVFISAGQINAFVPYEIAPAESVDVVVDIDGVRSAPLHVPVTSASFGLSAANGRGFGQGAILNSDLSVNNTTRPAARGSTIALFGTGEGRTSPPLPDGAFEVSTPFSTTSNSVKVTIGGKPATVTYAGAAPFLPTGVFQINVVIPPDAATGDAAIVVEIGTSAARQTITCAVN